MHCLCDLNCYHSPWIAYGEIFQYRTSSRYDKSFAHLESGLIQAISSLLEIEKQLVRLSWKSHEIMHCQFCPFLWSCSWNTPTSFACTFECLTMIIYSISLLVAHKDSVILHHSRWWTTTRGPSGNSFILATHSFPFLPFFTNVLLIFHHLSSMYLWKQRH